MVEANKLIDSLNTLYDYGEIDEYTPLKYLMHLEFLIDKEGKYIITKKWIKFSKIVTREDFISSLICYYPNLLETLLLRVYKEAVNIGRSGDSKALFEFIDSVPKFADKIIEIRNKEINEDEEIKSFYTLIFKGYPQYLKVLSIFKEMQKAEQYEQIEDMVIGKVPDKMWTDGRKVTSNVKLIKAKGDKEYSLVPFEYTHYKLKDDIKDILSYPWKTFLVVLGMVISESKSVGFEAISIKPQDSSNPYVVQDLNVYIHNTEGKEVRVGDLKKFVYELCISSNFLLFPDKEPDVNLTIFELMDENIFKYKDGQYLLEEYFNERIYQSEIILKNHSRKLKNKIKDYVEELRNVL
ncbi:hypothetical protein [Clostridium sporogenes]|uniref:Uncharacterized protein n=1 Tax=Clostridium sporogenes TaxID=1509 RepID=A0A7U4LNG4_CLOSG|nr:hypothetical protein [Clostridium sporogenes]AKC62819.1 hypothetical protein CLSPO_c20990 [Clostridium sporogenes]AKJ90070.1 hypothetical protein CLSPOx_10570 [Clostridium sporogenes]KCZ68197.1 hypothetical protein CSPO_6c02400 [Clostridium sporogenes]KOY64361.1 hypothetical protein AN649_18755 [Clostridium sporogenes]OOO65333.1 hypothetical protein BS099_15715 [Clostridium sporogenes]